MITKSHPSTVASYMAKKWYVVHLHAGKDLTNCPDVNFTGKVGQIASVTVPGDTITYENSSKQRFNFCDHSKDTFTHLNDCATSYRVHCTHQPAVYGPGYNYVAGSYYVPVRPDGPVLPEVTAQMRRLAWQGLLPQLEDGFSLANFLWELPEIPALLAASSRAASFLNNAPMKKLFGKISTKTASELVLLFSFALLPLKGDLEFIATNLPIMRKKVNKFIAEGKKAQSYHYRTELSSSTSLSGGSYDRYLRTVVKSEYYATLRCRYRYQPPSGLDALMRLWGLQVTPEVIWNAIPFSFVIDWFLKVGDFLAQFSRDPWLTVEIIDYCDTVKSWTSVEEVVGSGSGCADWATSPWHVHQHPGVVMWNWTRTKYVRTPGLPDTGVYFPVLDELSRRELVLAAALGRAQT